MVGDGASVSLLVEDSASLLVPREISPVMTLVMGRSRSGRSGASRVVTVLDVVMVGGFWNLNDTVVTVLETGWIGAFNDTVVVTVSVGGELVDVDATNVAVTVTVGVDSEVGSDATAVEVTVTTGVESEVGSDGTITTVVVDGAGGVTVRYTTEVTGSIVTVVGSGDMVIEAFEAFGSDLVTTADCVVLAEGSATEDDGLAWISWLRFWFTTWTAMTTAPMIIAMIAPAMTAQSHIGRLFCLRLLGANVS